MRRVFVAVIPLLRNLLHIEIILQNTFPKFRKFSFCLILFSRYTWTKEADSNHQETKGKIDNRTGSKTTLNCSPQNFMGFASHWCQNGYQLLSSLIRERIHIQLFDTVHYTRLLMLSTFFPDAVSRCIFESGSNFFSHNIWMCNKNVSRFAAIKKTEVHEGKRMTRSKRRKVKKRKREREGKKGFIAH